MITLISKEKIANTIFYFGTSPIEKIIYDYLKTFPLGEKQSEDYEQYRNNQLIFGWYNYLYSNKLKELSNSFCQFMIEDSLSLIEENEKFLRRNYYALKIFPIYSIMCNEHSLQKRYIKDVFIPDIQRYLEIGVVSL